MSSKFGGTQDLGVSSLLLHETSTAAQQIKIDICSNKDWYQTCKILAMETHSLI
jgi:hypothetical protein